MPTLSQLKTEIHDGPLAAELAPLVAVGHCEAIAQRLNALTFAALRPVPIFEYAMWSAVAGIKAKIRLGAQSANLAVADLCDTALSVMNNPHAKQIDLTDAGSMALVDALVRAEVVSADDRAALLRYCTRPASRAEVAWGLGVVVTTDDVAAALRS